MTDRATLTAAAAALALVAGSGAANPEIGRVTHITEGLITTAIAYEIDRVCDELGGRRIAGINFLWSLKDHASSLGFSDAEIRAYVDNKAEKDRLEAIARARLREMGAVEGQPETYCAVGRAEMAAGSPIGRFLR
jgi:hypothetical protein